MYNNSIKFDNKIFDEIKKITKDSIKSKAFNNKHYFYSRNFEIEFTSIATKEVAEMYDKCYDNILKKINLDKKLSKTERHKFESEIGTSLFNDLSNKAIKSINDNIQNDEDFSFCLFYLISTFFRRSKKMNINMEFIKNINSFEKYHDLFQFINIMAKYEVSFNDDEKYNIMDDAKKLLENEKMSDHIGLINLYGIIVADFYEENLEKRFNSIDALKINDAIKKVSSILNKNYPKFFSTYGRLLALAKKYDEAEINIQKAIEIETDDRRKSDFNDELFFISVIKTHDINYNNSLKINHDLENIKKMLDEKEKKIYKIGSIVVSILSLIFGAITITLKANDFKTISSILMLFFGSLSVILGFICILLFSKKDKILLASIFDSFEINILVSAIINQKNKLNFSHRLNKRIKKEMKPFINDKSIVNYSDDDLNNIKLKIFQWDQNYKSMLTKTLISIIIPSIIIILGFATIIYFAIKYIG